MGIEIFDDEPMANVNIAGENKNEEASQKTLGTKMAEVAAYGPFATAYGALESIGETLGVYEDGQMTAMFEQELADENSWVHGNYIGDAAGYYTEHNEGAKLAGETATMFVAVGAATKFIQTGGYLSKAFSKLGPVGDYLAPRLLSTGMTRQQRMASIAKAEELFVSQRNLQLANTEYQTAVKTQKFGMAKDLFKESVAGELALYAVLKDSEVFFPEEQSFGDYLMWAGVPAVGVSMIGGAAMRHYANNYVTANVTPRVRALINNKDLALTDLTTMPEFRGVGLAASSSFIADQKNTFDVARDAKERANLNALIVQESAHVDSYVVDMANDEIFGHGIDKGFKWNTAADKQYVNTVTSYTQSEPTAAISMVSIMPSTADSVKAVPAAKIKRIDSLTAGIREGLIELKTMAKGSPEQAAKFEEIKAMQMEKEKVQWLTTVVLEADQTVIPIAEKRWTMLDDIGDPSIVKTERADGFTKLHNEHGVKLGANIAMLDEGKLYFEATGKQQRDFVTVLPEHKVMDEQTNVASRALEDITHLYDLDQGVYGQRVREMLPEEVVKAMDGWKGTSQDSTLRKWMDESPQKLDKIREVFDGQGFRERLSQLADADGFLTLYRGEAVSHMKESPFNLVSMSPRPRTAQAFSGLPGSGKQTIKRVVHIDDIVMPINARSLYAAHEFEFIVKDTSKRITEQAMNHDQRIGAWTVTQRALDNFNPATQENTIRMARGRESFELDYAIKVLEKFPEADVRYIGQNGEVFGQEALREMQFESLRQKAFSFQEWYATSKLQDSGRMPKGIKLKETQKLPETEILRAHNLPLGDGFGDAPVVQLLKEIVPVGNGAPVDLRTVYKNLDEVEAAAYKRIMPNYLDEAGLEAKALRLDGSALKKELPTDMKPVIIHHNNTLEDRVTAESLNTLIADQKQVAQDGLAKADEAGGFIVKAVHDAWNGDGTIRHMVGRADNLTDGVQRGAGIMTTHNFVGRSAPQLQLADQIGEVAKKAGDQIVSKLWEEKSKVFTKILSSKHNEASNAVTMAAHEISHGWDILPDAISMGSGKYALALDPSSARNEKLAQNMFGRVLKEMATEDDVILLPIRSAPDSHVVLDELALEGLSGLTDLSHTYLDNVNSIRKAYGLTAINKRQWHLPYFNMENREVLWMMDESNKVAYPVTGSTSQQVAELAEEEIKAAAKEGKLLHYQSEAALRSHVERIGSQFEQMTDLSKAGMQTTGKSLRGSPTTAEIGPTAFKSIIERLQGNFDDVVRYSSAASMRSELDYASRMRNSLNLADDKVVRARETVFDHYTRSVLQTPSLTDKTARGALAKGIEDAADAGMSFVYDKYRGIVPSAAHATEGEFEAIQNLYGKVNSPYSDIVDMLAKTQKISTPPTSRKYVAAMNKFAGDYVLRVLDFGMPVINAASLVAVQPAVYKAMQRGKGEDLHQWKARIGAWTSVVDENFAMPNTGKMSATGIHHMFSPEGREALELYRDMGLLRHDVYERIEMITAPVKGYSARMYDKGIKTLSYATDKSEELARAGSFMMNHAVATKMLGLRGKAAVHFAHKHTNAVVGDYRAMNKPQIFQGVAGMPFGLFSTWVWNFGQRVFGDLEGGRLGAVGMQLAMQQIMFGAESHPMSNVMLEHVTTNYDGTENIVDRLERVVGPDATNVIMNGTIAQMSGIGIQGRSSVTAPAMFRGELSQDLIPALGITSTLIQGVNETIKASGADGLTMDKFREILSVYGVNGTIRNIATHTQGYSIDRAGDMVNSDVNNIVDSIAHGVELKSLREHERMREMAKDKRTEMVKREHLSVVRKSFKTLTRNIEGMEEEEFSERIDGIMGAYYEANGDPEMIRAMMRRWAVEANADKSLLLLVSRLKKNAQDGGTMKLYLDYAK